MARGGWDVGKVARKLKELFYPAPVETNPADVGVTMMSAPQVDTKDPSWMADDAEARLSGGYRAPTWATFAIAPSSGHSFASCYAGWGSPVPDSWASYGRPKPSFVMEHVQKRVVGRRVTKVEPSPGSDGGVMLTFDNGATLNVGYSQSEGNTILDGVDVDTEN